MKNNPLDKIDLINGLSELGLKKGMALEVHSSLSSFGYIDGGANTVIDALIEMVGEEGAIVMPSFLESTSIPLNNNDTLLGLSLKIKILNEDEKHSGMGIISDTFRQREDVISGKGVFRVSAWGKDAELHAETGFDRIINNNGYALLLGVDIYKLSSMHYMEDVLPNYIRNKFTPCEEAKKIYPENKWFIEGWIPPVKPWYKIQDKAYNKGLIQHVYIGNAKCMLLKVKPVVELYRTALIEYPYELYGLENPT